MIECFTTGSFFTNSYVISNDKGECVVVDPGLNYEASAAKIKQKYDVKAILITHGHIDHIDGVKYFSNVPIYVHKLDKYFFFDSSLSLYDMMGFILPFKENDLDIRTVEDMDEIDLIGYKFKVLHTPGHTRGSVCYSYSNKVLSGDTLFNYSCGRCDFPTGDSLKMHQSLKRIISTYNDNFDVYPGHDCKTTIKNERQNNPYL